MHHHTSKHQKRRWADARAAELLQAALPTNGSLGNPKPAGKYERGVLIVSTWWSGTVRSLGAARRICDRVGIPFMEPTSGFFAATRPTAAELARRAKWRVANDASWAARKVRST